MGIKEDGANDSWRNGETLRKREHEEEETKKNVSGN